MTSGEITVRVRRGNEAGDPQEYYRSYRISSRPRMTVLDALVSIQNEQDPTVGFRYSCRVGMCGTCAVRVNGRPRWACRTRLEALGENVTLEPLANFPVFRDLAVDMTPFLLKMKRVRGWFEAKEGASPMPAQISHGSRERLRIEPHIECITCGICYSSCGVVGKLPDFLGPAALNRGYTLLCDSRDSLGTERLRDVAGELGVWCCHSQFNCTDACPKGISPTAAINGIKRRAVVSEGKRLFLSKFRGKSPE